MSSESANGEEDLPWRWDVGVGTFSALATPRSAILAVVVLLLRCDLVAPLLYTSSSAEKTGRVKVPPPLSGRILQLPLSHVCLHILCFVRISV